MIDLSSFEFFENPRNTVFRKKDAFSYLQHAHPHLLNCFFFPSSGSSGLEKWACLSRESLVLSAKSVNDWIQASEEDVFLRSIPLFHVGGYGVELRAKVCGAKCVDLQGPWSGGSFVEAVNVHGATLSSLVPTQVYDLVSNRVLAPKSLRVIWVGGGALSSDLYLKARALGWPLLPTYGMTEAASQVATAKLKSLEEMLEPKMYVLPHWDAKVDEGGRLCLKGLALAHGTLRFSAQSGWAFDSIDSELGFFSEDRVLLSKVDGESTLQFLERDSDVFKIGGEFSSLTKLAQVLDEITLSMQLCQKFAVVDLSDARLGRKVALVYESDVDQHTVQRVQREFDSRVLPYEKVRSCLEVHRLPRSDLGKLLKPRLRIILETREKK